MEGKEYLITWVFGHLFSLADIEHYAPAPAGKRGWTFENLPCFPKTFDYQMRDDEGVKRQFDLIASLCNRADVTAIVNAGDADREGEIIVRTCVGKALKQEKPLLRLWLPDQTPQTVRAALSEMQPDSNYDALANEGYARTYIDWLYGVNLTRYASIITGKLLRVGRVIVPIVKAIYDRDKAIREFTPKTYYGVTSRTEVRGEEVVLNSSEEFDENSRDKAQALSDAYNALTTVVTDKKSKEDMLPPGKLYSLSTLQNVLGKKYKLSMKDSLDTVQALYERGFLTYPRTNSEYLATAEKGKMRQIIDNVAKLGYPVTFRDSKYIFDDSKIESHSALTPTYKIPRKEELNERESQVYSTVFRRFVAVFCAQVCRIERSEIRLKTGDKEEFVLRGTAILEPGWTKYDDYNKKDKFLPKLEIGETIETAFAPVEKQTTPPKHYTIETLNNYLKNPFKEDKAAAEERAAGEESGESDEEDYRAIFEGLELGTEATRTGIIDNARNSKYIELNKDTYLILPDGEFLIESLSEMGIGMDKYKTSQMGQALKRVYRGTMTVEESTRLAEEEIAEVFSHREEVMAKHGNQGEVGDEIGICPLCGARVVREARAYACEREGCTFRVGLSICRRPIAAETVKQILETGRTEVLDGFVSKNNRRFSSALMLQDGKVVFDMEKSRDGESVAGAKCPLCAKKMVYSRFSYTCSSKKCGFRIGRTILGRKITEEELSAFCTSGITPLLEGFVSKNDGKAFSAHLALRGGEAKIVPGNPDGTLPDHEEPQKPASRRKKEPADTAKTGKKSAGGAAKASAPAATLGKCPLCGEQVVRGRQNWGCMGYVHGCTLRIPFVWRGHSLTEEEARELLTQGRTEHEVPFDGGQEKLVLQNGVVTAAGERRP
jgi:DNA topoisomerase-3